MLQTPSSPLRIAWQKLQQRHRQRYLRAALKATLSSFPRGELPSSSLGHLWGPGVGGGGPGTSFLRQTLPGRGSEGASRGARERAADRRLRPALAAGALTSQLRGAGSQRSASGRCRAARGGAEGVGAPPGI